MAHADSFHEKFQDALRAGEMIVSVEFDEAGDGVWFTEHPFATTRHRLATPSELRLSGRAPGTWVRIVQTNWRYRKRVFPKRQPESSANS